MSHLLFLQVFHIPAWEILTPVDLINYKIGSMVLFEGSKYGIEPT